MKDIIEQLELSNGLYRFQGGNSCVAYDYIKNKMQYNRYIYFSKTKEHQDFFIQKRINQLLKEINLNSKEINNLQLYFRFQQINSIIKDIENDEVLYQKLQNLESIGFIIDKAFFNVLENNYIENAIKSKNENKKVERVDYKTYSGGYGFCYEWLELMKILSIFITRKRINNADILLILLMMQTGNKYYISKFNERMNDKGNYDIKVNEEYLSPFTKYRIEELLENILDKKTYNEKSNLGKYPVKTIRTAVNEYKESKEKVLKLLDKNKYSL